MTFPEDVARVRAFCGDSFGGLDVCMKEPGHDGNHVGADATWEPTQRMKRALLLAREAGKQLEVIRREQDERERQTQIELKPKEKK